MGSGLIGDAARQVLSDDPEWSAPAHAPIEALRTIRRYESAGLIATEQAEAYAAEVREAEVRYTGPERWLLAAVWPTRHNISPYDAFYLALAQHYDVRRAPCSVRHLVDISRAGAHCDRGLICGGHREV